MFASKKESSPNQKLFIMKYSKFPFHNHYRIITRTVIPVFSLCTRYYRYLAWQIDSSKRIINHRFPYQPHRTWKLCDYPR